MRFALFFKKILLFGNVSWTTNMKPYGRWKNLSDIFHYVHWIYPPFQLIIGSRLTLIQNELWVSKCYHVNSKVFFLCLRLKDVIKILAYYVS